MAALLGRMEDDDDGSARFSFKLLNDDARLRSAKSALADLLETGHACIIPCSMPCSMPCHMSCTVRWIADDAFFFLSILTDIGACQGFSLFAIMIATYGYPSRHALTHDF